MNDDCPFRGLLTAAKAGDERAAARLVEEYGPELRRYVRFQLTHPGVRRFLDSLDVCQSVLAAFFVRLKDGRIDLVHPRQLLRLLAMMAENKVKDKIRRHHAVRRGGATVTISGDPNEHAGRGTDPAAEVADKELVRAVRDRLPEDVRPLLDRWMGGNAWPDVAAGSGESPEAVRKRLLRSIDRAARELGLIEETP